MNRKEIIENIKKIAGSEKSRDEVLRDTVKILKENIDYYNWVGIYLFEGDELVLGPFSGKPSPHLRIPLNRGICGAAASQKKSIIVEDVTSDPRYLACSLETKSEIVVPIMKQDKVFGEIDIDSDRMNVFSQEDQMFLERICSILSDLF
ncbi:MAG: GAF domain-containing protein [candidate division Zixibacteria bacterium]|nr:GAF domain-containing protein [candidate division Zixibacteria bacterium]